MAEQLHPEDIYQTLEYEIVTLKIKPGETISENHSLQGHHRHPHQSGYRGSDRIPAHSR
mgnify:CR=1 FL=1